jgi:hypothetical protein
MRAKLRELGSIDVRSLALFRIGIALVLLGDLLVRLQDLRAHYSDAGVLPRHAMSADSWSLHLLSGSWQLQLVLFLVAFAAGVALLVGYRTRLATVVSWLLLISLHTRNPLILQGGDVLLRMLLFWAMFLPLGACWSLDQRRTSASQVLSVASVALLLQVCFVYWFTALLKTDESWTRSGSAVWYTLSIEQYSTPLGLYLLQFPKLLKWLTFATFYLELLGPFLAFSPWATARCRIVVVALFLAFHLVGLNLTMELAHFCYVCALAWILFLPSSFWNRLCAGVVQPVWRAGRASNAAALFFLGYVFLWNLRTLGLSVPLLTGPVHAVGPYLRIDQCWNMFAPHPLLEDGWYVIPAQLRDGTEVNLFAGGQPGSALQPVSWAKPPCLSATYKNDRWRSYLMNLMIEEEGRQHMVHYTHYLAREWNATHPPHQQLAVLDLAFMWKVNTIGAPPMRHKRVMLRRHICEET